METALELTLVAELVLIAALELAVEEAALEFECATTETAALEFLVELELVFLTTLELLATLLAVLETVFSPADEAAELATDFFALELAVDVADELVALLAELEVTTELVADLLTALEVAVLVTAEVAELATLALAAELAGKEVFVNVTLASLTGEVVVLSSTVSVASLSVLSA